MVANRDMNGNARGTQRLHQSEELFVFAFFTIAESTVAVDDQVSGSWVQRDDALGCFGKAIRHIYAFVLVLLDWCARPLRPRVETGWIDTDMSIGQQSHAALIQASTEEYEITSTSRGWNPASVVRAVTKIDGVSFAFYSLHICKSKKKVGGHAHRLATTILPKESTERVIVVGDFNNNIGDAAMNTIEEAGFISTWNDLKIDVSKEFTYNALDPKKSLGVIDHILYSTSAGAKVTEGGIIELKKPLSDHKPIWAEIVFPR